MSDKMIVCSHCDSINRLSEARSALEAKCGRCGRKLFAASPQDVSGTTFERHVARTSIGAAFMVAILGICILVVAQFGSFRFPLVILTPILLTFIGIMLGHWLFGAPFTATSMIGFIALAGIIVRNLILLVDFIRHTGGIDRRPAGGRRNPLQANPANRARGNDRCGRDSYRSDLPGPGHLAVFWPRLVYRPYRARHPAIYIALRGKPAAKPSSNPWLKAPECDACAVRPPDIARAT
jgi:hypothetical protein